LNTGRQGHGQHCYQAPPDKENDLDYRGLTLLSCLRGPIRERARCRRLIIVPILCRDSLTIGGASLHHTTLAENLYVELARFPAVQRLFCRRRRAGKVVAF